MLFLKSFLRTLIRHKAFTFINLFGLTFSLAFILLIGRTCCRKKISIDFTRILTTSTFLQILPVTMQISISA